MNITRSDSFSADISEFELWSGASETVPEMPDSAYQELKANIRKNGILEPLAVVKPEKKFLVLDGHARLKAAEKLGLSSIPAQLVPVSQDEYALFVLVRAADRKHLTSGQRAVLAAELNDMLLPLKRRHGFLQVLNQLGVRLPSTMKKQTRTQEIATRHFQASTGYLASARKIKRHDAALYALLRQGKVSMYEAKRCFDAYSKASEQAHCYRRLKGPELVKALESAHVSGAM